MRLGVTGLSRAGKTVFITALIHGLTRGGRFPVFEPYATGRIARARLEPQPDDAVPRFDYENHVRTLIEERRWPNSTVDISELRLVVDYQRQNGADRTLTIDIVDYPGEWLLDLPLLNKSYEQWSAESLALSREGPRADLAGPWHTHLATLQAEGRENEQAALAAAKLFTDYLRACRDERFAMSLLPPGRFLMPGNLAGSPALTFAPLDVAADGSAPDGSLWAMMRRRYEAYKDVVVRPFFRDHFARLDRQIVLVDALAAFNSGPEALHDLEAALTGILDCFRIGHRTLLSNIFRPRSFTSVVTDTGNVPLTNVAVGDDKLGPITSFTGDSNGNGLLDLTETWIYTQTATALAGQQTNTGTVTGQDVNARPAPPSPTTTRPTTSATPRASRSSSSSTGRTPTSRPGRTWPPAAPRPSPPW